MQGSFPVSQPLPFGHGRASELLTASRRPLLWLLGILLLHVTVWTCFGTLTHGVIHHDMTEAWAWGKELQLGYSKHPPLFAWVAGLWFKLMPRENWSFFLLSSLNGAVGLAGAWMIAGRLLPRPAQWAALLLLMLTPFYGLLSLKFNANTILLSIWPWTAYFFIRALETRSALHGIIFGVLAGLALLGKYYSALLLASCFLAAVLHPQARVIFRSAAPYLAAVACAIVIAPHALWTIGNGFPTVDYAMSKTQYPAIDVLARGANAVLIVAAFHTLLVVAVFAAFAGFRRRLPARLWISARSRENWWILALALGPFALTLLACVGQNVRISSQFMMPIFFMVPTALLALSRLKATPARLAMLLIAAGGSSAIAAVAALPVGVIVRETANEVWREPTKAVAQDATRLWHETFGRTVEIVSGDTRYAHAASFYSPDAPSSFTDFNFRDAPWITPQKIAQSGMLVLCHSESALCLERATHYETTGSRRLERTYAIKGSAWLGRAHTFVRRITIVLIAPVDSNATASEPD